MSTRATQSEVDQRLQAAVTFARDAGHVALRHFARTDLAVERKGDDSPVTVADREAELRLRELILGLFPHDAVVGEEHGVVDGTSGYCWVLDPIDGTKSFIHGIPLYTTLIGILATGSGPIDQGEPVAGVIHTPALAETVWAPRGGVCQYQRGEGPAVTTRVNTTARLAESLLVTSEVATFGRRTPSAMPAFLNLQSACRLVRTWGDGYGYLLVATGRAEVAIDPIMNLWDAAALLPVIEAAGGEFTSWTGEVTVHSGDSVATNGQMHDEVLALTRTP